MIEERGVHTLLISQPLLSCIPIFPSDHSRHRWTGRAESGVGGGAGGQIAPLYEAVGGGGWLGALLVPFTAPLLGKYLRTL